MFEAGKSGNPNGRPKGSKNKLGESFVRALYEDFEENGIAVIQQVRADNPVQYLKVIASILPKELTINEGESALERILNTVSDADLATFTEACRQLSLAGDGDASREAIAQTDSADGFNKIH